MSNLRSFALLFLSFLLLLSFFWFDPVATQHVSPDSPPKSHLVHDDRLTASINPMPMIGELKGLDAAPATQDSRSRENGDVVSNIGARPYLEPDQAPDQAAALLGTPPEWAAALQHADKDVRRDALQRWAGQGMATPLDPLTLALVDPDEFVRAKAQELVEQVWLAKAGAR